MPKSKKHLRSEHLAVKRVMNTGRFPVVAFPDRDAFEKFQDHNSWLGGTDYDLFVASLQQQIEALSKQSGAPIRYGVYNYSSYADFCEQEGLEVDAVASRMAFGPSNGTHTYRPGDRLIDLVRQTA